jgi:hypothetical protein
VGRLRRSSLHAWVQAAVNIADVLAKLHSAGFVHRNVTAHSVRHVPGGSRPWALYGCEYLCQEGKAGLVPDNNLGTPPERAQRYTDGERIQEAHKSEDVYALARLTLANLLKESAEDAPVDQVGAVAHLPVLASHAVSEWRWATWPLFSHSVVTVCPCHSSHMPGLRSSLSESHSVPEQALTDSWKGRPCC